MADPVRDQRVIIVVLTNDRKNRYGVPNYMPKISDWGITTPLEDLQSDFNIGRTHPIAD